MIAKHAVITKHVVQTKKARSWFVNWFVNLFIKLINEIKIPQESVLSKSSIFWRNELQLKANQYRYEVLGYQPECIQNNIIPIQILTAKRVDEKLV